jgi:hypothetical protein
MVRRAINSKEQAGKDNLAYVDPGVKLGYRKAWMAATLRDDRTHVNMDNKATRARHALDDVWVGLMSSKLKSFKHHKLVALQLQELKKRDPLVAVLTCVMLPEFLSGVSHPPFRTAARPRSASVETYQAFADLISTLVPDHDSVSLKMAWRAISTAGLGRPIKITSEKYPISFIESISSFDIDFTPVFVRESLVADECLVMAIDGYVQDHDQIMPILEACLKARTPGLIMCRGAASQIVELVRSNVEAGRIDCTLLSVNEEQDPFAMHDLARLLGIETVKFVGNPDELVDLYIGRAPNVRLDAGTNKLSLKIGQEHSNILENAKSLQEELHALDGKTHFDEDSKERYVRSRIRRLSPGGTIMLHLGRHDVMTGRADPALVSLAITTWSAVINEPLVSLRSSGHAGHIGLLREAGFDMLPLTSLRRAIDTCDRLTCNLNRVALWIDA